MPTTKKRTTKKKAVRKKATRPKKTGPPEVPFEELFYNVMYDCIRETNVYMNLQHQERFRDTCKKAGLRLELAIMNIVVKSNKALLDDMKKLTGLVKELAETTVPKIPEKTAKENTKKARKKKT